MRWALVVVEPMGQEVAAKVRQMLYEDRCVYSAPPPLGRSSTRGPA